MRIVRKQAALLAEGHEGNMENVSANLSEMINARREAASDAPDSVQFVSFAIAGDCYGVDIMAVREIKGWSGITHLPKQPDYVRGVLNLRGVMVPIIDLRRRFDEGETEASPLHVVIIVQVGERLTGLLADRVLDIVSVEAENIQPVPQVARASQAGFMSGLVTHEDGMIALIDLSNLLSTDGDAANGADAEPSHIH
jgi:purine-binding chemotaxis protein CheW